MDIVGIDISKAKFDAALLLGERVRHGNRSHPLRLAFPERQRRLVV